MRDSHNPRPQRVPLSSINTLTFKRGHLTTARRGKPIPQLTCLGKPCARYQPETVACFNIGDDGLGGVQWKCEADLPNNMRFGSVQVSCEGWNKAGDREVLQGSCGLEYTLINVDPALDGGYNIVPSRSSLQERLPGIMFSALFIAVAGWIFWSFLKAMVRSWWGQNGGRRDGDRRIGWGGGGGGGGGGQPPPPPPPPYTPYPKPPPPTTSPNPPTTGAGQGFGFWTGLGLGGLGAYLATRRRDPRLEESYHARDAAWGGFGRHDGYERRGGRVEREFDRTAGAGRVDVAESSRMGEMRMRRGTAFGGTDVR